MGPTNFAIYTQCNVQFLSCGGVHLLGVPLILLFQITCILRSNNVECDQTRLSAMCDHRTALFAMTHFVDIWTQMCPELLQIPGLLLYAQTDHGHSRQMLSASRLIMYSGNLYCKQCAL